MYEFHKDKDRYFQYQYLTAKNYLIPFIEEYRELEPGLEVLEIGCGEAGVLLAFRERGDNCTGIDLADWRIERAEERHAAADLPGKIRLINKNIYDIDPDVEFDAKFDLIILKDVIEHIPEQHNVLKVLRSFLKPDGLIFFGFPPWYMPFGGHQQVCESRILQHVPYFHLLPKGIYKWILESAGEKGNRLADLLDIKDTGISIERFERILTKTGYAVRNKKFWLLNPIYKYKFGKGPVRQTALIGGIPFVRNFLTTAVYYLVEPSETD